jgi:hypothetical protein
MGCGWWRWRRVSSWRYASRTHPNQHAAVVVASHLLGVDEFDFEIVYEGVI